jgi:hypothetical protein
VVTGGILLVITSNDMSKQENLSLAKAKAAGSTPAGAFPSLPISVGCFGEAYSAAVLFVSFCWLF